MCASIGSWIFYACFYWVLKILCLLLLKPDDSMFAPIGTWRFYAWSYWILRILCLLLLLTGDFALLLLDHEDFMFPSIGIWWYYVYWYWFLKDFMSAAIGSWGLCVCCVWPRGFCGYSYWFVEILNRIQWIWSYCLLGIFILLLLLTGDCYVALIACWGFYLTPITCCGFLCCSYCLLWTFMLLLLLTMDCYFAPNAYYGPLCCSYCSLWIAILLLLLTGILFCSYCFPWILSSI